MKISDDARTGPNPPHPLGGRDRFARYAPAALCVLFAFFGWQFSYDHRTSQDDVFYGTPIGVSPVAFAIAALFLLLAVTVWIRRDSENSSRLMRSAYTASVVGSSLALLCLLHVGWLFSDLLLH